MRLGGVEATVLYAVYVIAFQAGIVAGTWAGGVSLGEGSLPPPLCLGLAVLTLPLILATTRPSRSSRRAPVT